MMIVDQQGSRLAFERRLGSVDCLHRGSNWHTVFPLVFVACLLGCSTPLGKVVPQKDAGLGSGGTTPDTGAANLGDAGSTGGVVSAGGRGAAIGTSGAGEQVSTGGSTGGSSSDSASTQAPAACRDATTGMPVDIRSDNNNCGACGRVCSALAPSSALCSNGLCLVTLASGQNSPRGIAVDATSVVWTNAGTCWMGEMLDGAVLKISPGGGTPYVLASAQFCPEAVALDANNAYWVNTGSGVFEDGSVMKVAMGGGLPMPLASELRLLPLIAVDAAYVYGVGLFPAQFKVPVAGGEPSMLSSVMCTGLAVDATSAYMTIDEGVPEHFIGVIRHPLGGGADTNLAVEQEHPRNIAVDGSSVYWVNQGNDSSTLMKVSRNGGTPIALASGLEAVRNIVVDGTSIYWTNVSAVMKLPVSGGTAVVLASGQERAMAITVDSTSVYWTTVGSGNHDGTVLRLTPK